MLLLSTKKLKSRNSVGLLLVHHHIYYHIYGIMDTHTHFSYKVSVYYDGLSPERDGVWRLQFSWSIKTPINCSQIFFRTIESHSHMHHWAQQLQTTKLNPSNLRDMANILCQTNRSKNDGIDDIQFSSVNESCASSQPSTNVVIQ